MNWKEDKNLEEALLQVSLLFLRNKIQNKRDNLFRKFVLSLIFSNKASNKDEILSICQREYPNSNTDANLIESTLKSLSGYIENLPEGTLQIKSKIKHDTQTYVQEVGDKMNSIVEQVLETVRSAVHGSLSQELQVRTNIKNCFEYYFKVASLSYFDLTGSKVFNDIEGLEKIAGNNLSANTKEVTEQILYCIGNLINTPTSEQLAVLETMARMHVSAQMMNMDPNLSSFKATQLRQKVFVLDTDVVLYAITENASHSKEYRNMIKQLSASGCKLYIPSEIIQEVYDHAEASLKRMNHVYDLVGNSEVQNPQLINNVFIEDFHFSILNHGKTISWERYIENYFDRDLGIDLLRSQIESKLGDKICYDKLPTDYDVTKDANYDSLYQAVLNETKETEKASFRTDEKNESIARTDTTIYLTIRKANLDGDKGDVNKSKNKLLMFDNYFLTSSIRVLLCAKKLGIDLDVLCNPKALLAYFVEVGHVNPDNIEFTKLFDNPFLIYTSKIIEEDVNTFIKSGIEIKGRNLIRMQYDLSAEMKKLLTTFDADDFIEAYKAIKEKGYSYSEPIEEIINGKLSDEKKIEELTAMLEKSEKRNEQLESKVGLLQYQNRTGQKNKDQSYENLKRRRRRNP